MWGKRCRRGRSRNLSRCDALVGHEPLKSVNLESQNMGSCHDFPRQHARLCPHGFASTLLNHFRVPRPAAWETKHLAILRPCSDLVLHQNTLVAYNTRAYSRNSSHRYAVHHSWLVRENFGNRTSGGALRRDCCDSSKQSKVPLESGGPQQLCIERPTPCKVGFTI